MDIRYILSDLLATRDLQEWVNHRFSAADRIVIDTTDIAEITLKGGAKFRPTRSVANALHVHTEYDFSGIRPHDHVVDIGACVGGFSIQAALKEPTCHVYAVEPLYGEDLRANIELNCLEDQITVIEAGLGYGAPVHVAFGYLQKTIPTMPLKEIFALCGGCDFLKCDCEGGEWTINPLDLTGVRRVELEAHYGYQSAYPETRALPNYLKANYRVVKSQKNLPNLGGFYHCYSGDL
jgi:FkbM family methyltransferase